MAGLDFPLSTLHPFPRGNRRMTRGRIGTLSLNSCASFIRYSPPAFTGAFPVPFSRVGARCREIVNDHGAMSQHCGFKSRQLSSNLVVPTFYCTSPSSFSAVGFLLGTTGFSPGKPSSNGVLFRQGCRCKFAASRLPGSDSRGSNGGRPDEFESRFR